MTTDDLIEYICDCCDWDEIKDMAECIGPIDVVQEFILYTHQETVDEDEIIMAAEEIVRQGNDGTQQHEINMADMSYRADLMSHIDSDGWAY